MYLGNGLELAKPPVVLGSDVTTYQFTGLNGDYDGGYLLLYSLPFYNGGNTIITLTFNNDTTAGNYGWQHTNSGSALAAARGSTNETACYLSFKYNVTDNEGYAYIPVASSGGTYRTVFSRDIRLLGSLTKTGLYVGMMASEWLDTSSNITSIEIRSDVASSIKANSIFKLYRIKR